MRIRSAVLLATALLLSVRSTPLAAQRAASPDAPQRAASADVLKASVTISAIDPASREITFRDATGNTDTVVAGPEVKRFDELKVGDRVNLTYYFARIFELRKAGSEPKPAGTAGDVATKTTPTDGALPGATVTRRMTETVAVRSTNLNTGTISVVRPDGSVVTRTLQDPSQIQGVVAGDRIEVTYAEGLLIDVERP